MPWWHKLRGLNQFTSGQERKYIPGNINPNQSHKAAAKATQGVTGVTSLNQGHSQSWEGMRGQGTSEGTLVILRVTTLARTPLPWVLPIPFQASSCLCLFPCWEKQEAAPGFVCISITCCFSLTSLAQPICCQWFFWLFFSKEGKKSLKSLPEFQFMTSLKSCRKIVGGDFGEQRGFTLIQHCCQPHWWSPVKHTQWGWCHNHKITVMQLLGVIHKSQLMDFNGKGCLTLITPFEFSRRKTGTNNWKLRKEETMP